MEPSNHHVTQLVRDCIRGHRSLRVQYRGKRREIFPLVWGRLKRGDLAMLALKRLPGGRNGYHLGFRLYLAEHLRVLKPTGPFPDSPPEPDYYLTRNFEEIFIKI